MTVLIHQPQKMAVCVGFLVNAAFIYHECLRIDFSGGKNQIAKCLTVAKVPCIIAEENTGRISICADFVHVQQCECCSILVQQFERRTLEDGSLRVIYIALQRQILQRTEPQVWIIPKADLTDQAVGIRYNFLAAIVGNQISRMDHIANRNHKPQVIGISGLQLHKKVRGAYNRSANLDGLVNITPNNGKNIAVRQFFHHRHRLRLILRLLILGNEIEDANRCKQQAAQEYTQKRYRKFFTTHILRLQLCVIPATYSHSLDSK